MLGLFVGSPLVVMTHYSTAGFWFVMLFATIIGYWKGNQKWKTLDVAVVFAITVIFAVIYSHNISSGWQVEDTGNAISILTSGIITVDPVETTKPAISIFSGINPREYLITIPCLLILVYGFYRLLKWDKVPVLYKSWAVVVELMLLAGAVYPPVSATINFTRYYQLMLIVLAPCIIFLFRWNLKIAVPILVTVFLFSSGLIFNIFQINNISHFNIPYSIALENNRLDAGNYLTTDDRIVAQWAYDNGYDNVTGDLGGVGILQNYFSVYQAKPISTLIPGNVVLLRTWNTQHNTIAVTNGPGLRKQVPLPQDLKYQIIYESGECRLVEIQ
jgi:hypothetical protein